MNNFFRLVANENMKIFSRVRTWVMLAILVGFNIIIPLMMKLAEAEMNPWTAFSMTESFTFMLNTIFCAVIAADMVAGEYTWGTIKLLLIRPWSRSKILASKFLSVVLFSVLGTLTLAVTALLTSFLLFSEGGFLPNAEETGVRIHLLGLLTDYIELFIIILVSFMISTVFRSSSLAIGLSLFVLFTKDLFGLIFRPEKYEWAKYILFLHMDLSGYIHGDTGPGGVGLGFSVAVLAGYALVFILISWQVFARRDVAG